MQSLEEETAFASVHIEADMIGDENHLDMVESNDARCGLSGHSDGKPLGA